MADVKVRIIGEDKASDDLKRVDSSLDNLAKGSRMAVGSWTELTSVLGLAGRVVGAVKKVFDETIVSTVTYAKQVRDLSRNLGVTSEETSRLIQVADDYQVSVGSLETAMKMALKNGFQPTTANLADLADKYVALQSPTERAAMLTKIFGRNWAELTPMLEQGGEALRKQAAEIDKNLILTAEQVKAAREYEIALDNWNDSITALKTNIGNELIPTLTKMIDAQNRSNEIANAAPMAYRSYGHELNVQKEKVRQMVEYVGDWGGKQEWLNQKTQEGVNPASNLADAVNKLGDAYSYASRQALPQPGGGTLDQMEQVYADALTALQNYNGELAERVDLEERLKRLSGEETAEEQARDKVISALTIHLGLGNIALSEYNDILARVATGAYDAEAAMRALSSAINALPTFKEIQIQIDQSGWVPPPGWTPPAPSGGTQGGWGDEGSGGRRAAGGPVSAGMPYLVGERGPELFVPGQSGGIVSNDKLGGGDVIFAGDIIISTPAAAERFWRRADDYRARARAGRGYAG